MQINELPNVIQQYKIIQKDNNNMNGVVDIITDEIKHASKYNYIFTLNSTMQNSAMNGSLMGQYIIY